MATPSLDITSSPDPLNDSAISSILQPSSGRVTRSQRSNRFVSLGSTSPRKQTFELEVGDNRSPQKLLVTVETENGNETTTTTARRRLFQSPSPAMSVRPRVRTTTTTVPLRESIEEEVESQDPLATPKRRGRPRKSNGTPLPSAAKKRRAGTPIRRTPRRARTTSTDATDEPTPSQPSAGRTPRRARSASTNATDDMSVPEPVTSARRTPRRTTPRRTRTASVESSNEPPAFGGDDELEDLQPTPRSARRGRPPKRRPAELSSELGTEPIPRLTSVKRSARRRQALAPEELMELADVVEGASLQDEGTASENEVDLVRAPSDSDGNENETAPNRAPSQSVDPEEDGGPDLWMATMSDQETPRASRSRPAPPAQASPDLGTGADQDDGTPRPAEPQEDFGDEGDYGYLAPAASDVSSADEPVGGAAPRNDTIAQGEDFSMIFMDSIPSLQADLSIPPPEDVHNDFGEETNLIINNTLESLRQDVPQDEEEDAPEEDMALVEEPVEMEEDIEVEAVPVPEPEPELEAEPEAEVEPELEEEQYVVESISPIRALSPRLARSPLKANSSPLRHQVLKLNARQAENSPGARSFAEAGDATPTAPAGTRRRSSAIFNADESNMYEDSFSEIPQDVLAAATPAKPRAFLEPELEEEEEPEVDDAMELIHQETESSLEEEEEEEELGQEQQDVEDVLAEQIEEQIEEEVEQMVGEQVEEQLEEQFGGHFEEQFLQDMQQQDEELAEELAEELENDVDVVISEEQENQNFPSYGSGVTRSDASRLPTPDDTPPQNDAETADNQDKSTEPSPASSKIAASASIARSSPARFQPQVQLQSQQQQQSSSPPQPQFRLSVERIETHVVEATPMNQMSSPIQDPQSLLPEPVQEKLRRPTLSPIVRAGRALQSVTSDPPSPEGREQQLRSPFRSSTSRESLQMQGSRERFQASANATPTQPARPSSSQAFSNGRVRDDPFGAGSQNTGQFGFLQALSRGMSGIAEVARSPSRKSDESSMRVTPQGDEMSWVADEGPISPSLRGDVSLREVAQASAARSPQQVGPIAVGQIDGAADEPDEEEEEAVEEEADEAEESGEETESEQDGDDETDIWEVEARRETPRSSRQQPFGKKAAVPLHKRAALPSPWTKRANEREQSPVQASAKEARGFRSQQVDGSPDRTNEVDEFSMLAQQRAAQEEEQQRQRQQQQQQPTETAGSATKTKGFDLSSFFSSPAAIPGMLAEKFLSSRPKTTAGQPSQPGTAEEPTTTMPTTSMFPPLPQQENEPESSPRRDMFSPVRRTQQQQQRGLTGASQQGDESPATPEDLEMPTVAQKKNFTPRPRQTSQSFFQSSSARAAPAPAPAPSSAAAQQTPPRMQLSHADIERWQQETSNSSDDSLGFRRPLLRPLPPKNASPTKSSLRSPLKPRTPGRVVEFTSSVLSPMDQARARFHQEQQEQLNEQEYILSSGQPPQGARFAEMSSTAREREDKENQDTSDIQMTDASPLAKMKHPVPLSEITWTRQHWLFLDELLQLRREGPFDVDYERRADKYLGKTVKSQGEAMTMERWHLDCVDAFKAEVGGWDEGALAKRLFALIVGEERRKRELRAGSSRVVFH